MVIKLLHGVILLFIAVAFAFDHSIHTFKNIKINNCITAHLSSKAPRQTVLFATTPLVANGKRYDAEPGSSMILACQKLGLKVPTDCKKGQCGTCTVTVGGLKIKACVGKVPPAPKLKSLIEKGLLVKVDN